MFAFQKTLPVCIESIIGKPAAPAAATDRTAHSPFIGVGLGVPRRMPGRGRVERAVGGHECWRVAIGRAGDRRGAAPG